MSINNLKGVCFGDSKDIHSLIQISLSYSEDEAFTYFREAADMIEKRAEVLLK